MNHKLEISTTTILKFFGVALGLWLLWLVRDVLALVFVVLIIVAALSPVVDKWATKIPRILAVILLFLIIAAVLSLAGLIIVPPLVTQTKELADNLPYYLEKITPIWQSWRDLIASSQQGLVNVSTYLGQISSSIFTRTLGFVSGLVALVTIIVLSFYLLVDQKGINKFFISLMPIEQREGIIEILRKIGAKMGNWVRGQLLLAVVVGILDLIGLSIVGVPFALTLAVWAALTEIIPYIGPILGGIPAVIIAFLVSPIKGLIILIIYIGVQQLEGHILVPKIMQKQMGLSPVIIILAIIVGAKLGGILGVILAVPAAAALSVLAHEWPELRKTWANK